MRTAAPREIEGQAVSANDGGVVAPQDRRPLAAVLRGLSALFWGLPLALLAFARHFLAFLPSRYDLLLPPLAAGLVLFGLWRLTPFQPGERVWQRSLLASQILALVVLGLSPFLFLWSRQPGALYHGRAVLLLLGASLSFLVALMHTLRRLAAMLPDEVARDDTRLLQGFTTYVVAVMAGVSVTLYLRLGPGSVNEFLDLPRQPLGFGHQALLMLLLLVPVALAMAATWKLKEVVMAMAVGPGKGSSDGSAETPGR